MLSCTGLSFSYQGKRVLNDVNFTVVPGEIFALYGHNGSGKSTLLKLLGGSLPVHSGSILWMKEPATAKSGYVRHNLRRRLGVLFQNSSSDEKLSLVDNLIFSARLYGQSMREAEEGSRLALECAGLTTRAKDPVKKLSHGMRRRLELYRCFMHSPKVLLLDEPTAGLDVAEVRKFFNFLKQYRDEKSAMIIMASHHADELLHANRVAMFNEGTVLTQGTPSEMLSCLDYLRCSFSLENNESTNLQSLNLYDQQQSKDGIISAKFKSVHLDGFLKSSVLREVHFKSISIEKPSLADVYRDLVQNGCWHE